MKMRVVEEKLRAENENESSEEKESWELEWDSWIFKNAGLIKTESALQYDF